MATTHIPEQLNVPEQLNIENGAQRVLLTWQDGHVSIYPWWYLRAFCPCAGCQGHGGPYTFRPVEPGDSGGTDRANALGEVLEVGNYALNLTWEDGHRTGIYPFDLLRRLCACATCRETAATAVLWAQMGDREQARWGAEAGA